jgi:hypothetical protein
VKAQREPRFPLHSLTGSITSAFSPTEPKDTPSHDRILSLEKRFERLGRFELVAELPKVLRCPNSLSSQKGLLSRASRHIKYTVASTEIRPDEIFLSTFRTVTPPIRDCFTGPTAE